MPMWDLPRRKQIGFTLIEMTVVLVILGMVTALALPNLVNLYHSVERRTSFDAAFSSFNALGRRAHRQKSGFVLSAPGGRLETTDQSIALAFPENWRVELSGPVRFLSNGACLGGEIRIIEDQELLHQQSLEKPFCRLEATW
ncbi:type II secretion system GspH family protein [Gammaproteobacteria bacterium]|nr:type II secretion system GspH family protein [Gammaproteobacteria bacterium]